MKEILIGVDFSESDQKLADTVAPIAKAMGATIHLFHVLSEGTGGAEYLMGSIYTTASERRVLMKEGAEKIHEFAKVFDSDGVAVRSSIRQGNVVSTLLEEAKDDGCVMLVLGTHGYSRIERALLGHVVDRVLRSSPVPVLVVPTVRC